MINTLISHRRAHPADAGHPSRPPDEHHLVHLRLAHPAQLQHLPPARGVLEIRNNTPRSAPAPAAPDPTGRAKPRRQGAPAPACARCRHATAACVRACARANGWVGGRRKRTAGWGRKREGGGEREREGWLEGQEGTEGGIIAEWVRVFARACVCKRVRVGASAWVGDVGADILRAVDRETRRLPS